jgi:hypothetical protein
MEEFSERMCESLDELVYICNQFILMAKEMMPEIESTRKNKLVMKTAASSFGVAAISLSAGAIFAPATAGVSLTLGLGISAIVATAANGGLAVGAGVYKILKTKFFTKFLRQRKKILKEISKQFESFYEIISKTKEFQEIATLIRQSSKKKINLKDEVELLSKFSEELRKHQKIIVELREVIVTPNTGEQKYDLISSESAKGTVTLKTYVIAHRSTPDSKIDEEFLNYDIILETTGIKRKKSNQNRIPKLSKYLQILKDYRIKISVVRIAVANSLGAEILKSVTSAAARPAANVVIRSASRSAPTFGMPQVAARAAVGIKKVSTPANAFSKSLFGIGVVLTAVDLYFLVRDWRNKGRIKETIEKLEQEVLHYTEMSRLIRCIRIINYDKILEFIEI